MESTELLAGTDIRSLFRENMEQQLINQLVTLICKSGGSALIKDLLRETDVDGNSRNWTVEEMENAINYLTWINKNYSAADATAVVLNLIKDYQIDIQKLKGATI